MRAIVFFSAFTYLLFLFSTNPLASQTAKVEIVLKSSTVVAGPNIYLSEIVVLRPKNKALKKKFARLVVTKAAPPGESKDISVNFIRRLLRQKGLYKHITRVTGPKIIRVTTGHRDITRMRLEDAVGAFFESRLKGFAGDWKLEFKRIPDSLAVPLTEYRLRVVPKGKLKQRGYQMLSIEVMQQGVKVNRALIGVLLHTFETVYVAKHKIPARKVLRPDDFYTQLRETTYLTDEPVGNLKDRSLRSRVFVAADRILTRKMVEEIPAVERGAVVELQIIVGNVKLQTRAVAQQSGNLHDMVRVWSHETRRVLQGRVVGPQKVQVTL